MFETFKEQSIHEFVTYFLHQWCIFLIWAAILYAILNFLKWFSILFYE